MDKPRVTPRDEVRISPEAGPALDAVLIDWYAFRSAKTPLEQADTLIRLSNSMFDLSTYHPDFDGETGEITYED